MKNISNKGFSLVNSKVAKFWLNSLLLIDLYYTIYTLHIHLFCFLEEIHLIDCGKVIEVYYHRGPIKLNYHSNFFIISLTIIIGQLGLV